jgi:hypothetical protein
MRLRVSIKKMLIFKIFRHQDGNDPELCAMRKVTARYWNYNTKPERPHALPAEHDRKLELLP